MAISSTDVSRAFKIQSGSTDVLNGSLKINYVKYNNQTTDVPVSLINTSPDFYIKAYPNSSMFAVYKSGSIEQITQTNPIVIEPTQSRNVTVRVVTDLNNEPEQTRNESILFVLNAMVKGTSNTVTSGTTSSTPSGTTTFGGGGGSGGAEPSTPQTDATIPTPPPQF